MAKRPAKKDGSRRLLEAVVAAVDLLDRLSEFEEQLDDRGDDAEVAERHRLELIELGKLGARLYNASTHLTKFRFVSGSQVAASN